MRGRLPLRRRRVRRYTRASRAGSVARHSHPPTEPNIDLHDSTVAVTGATGFLGRYIVDALLGRSARVIGVVRNPDRVPELAARGVELRRADLSDRDALLAGFEGADAVVSNAALFSLRRLASLSPHNRRDHRRANVDGTRNVFDALTAAGVRRVVHVSSVAIYDGRRRGYSGEDQAQLSERTRPTPFNAYAVSKALSEQLAWRLARERGLALTTVRPCAIYGAFDPNFTRILERLLSLPVTVVPVGLHLPLVYAGDVAEAIALALESAVAQGRAYNTTGDDATFREVIRAWEAAGGRKALVKIPLPTPFRQSFDHRRATRDLGWHNRPLVEGFRDTLARRAQAE